MSSQQQPNPLHIEDEAIAYKVKCRQIENLYLDFPLPLMVAVILTVVMWIVLTTRHDYRLTLIWLGASCLVYLVRYRDQQKFIKLTEEDREYSRALKRFKVGVFISALLWGGVQFFLQKSSIGRLEVFYVLLVGGVVSGALSGLCSVLSAYIIYITTMLAGTCFFFFNQGGGGNYGLGLASILYYMSMFAVARRLSEKFRVSLHLEISNAELADKLKLNNSELEVAMNQAEAANEAKSNFLAVISHEIRTPMNGVLGMLELLRVANMNDEDKKCVGTAHLSAENLLRLLDDLLDFSKSNQGAMTLEEKTFSFKETVEEVVHLMSSRATQKGISFSYVWNNNAPDYLLGDTVRIKQILGNLLGNAIKFTHEGEVKLELMSVDLDNECCVVTFTVADSGIGISESAIEHLFEPFQQADSSMTRNYGGTGLGLAISKQLVEQMGGEIEISSVLGQGSIFKFHLKLKLAEEHAFLAKEEAEVTKTFYLGKVLVVEDDRINRQVIRMMLRRVGIEAVFAVNGLEGVSKAKKSRFDLIFMDMQMPELDGVSAAKEIRVWEKQNSFDEVPIIALSANAREQDRINCLNVGMNDFVKKPLTLAILYRVMNRWLAGRLSEK